MKESTRIKVGVVMDVLVFALLAAFVAQAGRLVYLLWTAWEMSNG